MHHSFKFENQNSLLVFQVQIGVPADPLNSVWKSFKNHKQKDRNKISYL